MLPGRNGTLFKYICLSIDKESSQRWLHIRSNDGEDFTYQFVTDEDKAGMFFRFLILCNEGEQLFL